MPSFKIFSSVIAGVLCLCASATSVRAESAIPGCKQGNSYYFQSVPASNGETIPANTPALLVRFQSSVWTFETAQILDPSGQAVAITISDSYLIHPVQNLPEGDGLSLLWNSSCSDYSGPSNQTKTVLFNVGPAVSFPTTIGTVEMIKGEGTAEGLARFNLHLSPEALAFSTFALITAGRPGQAPEQSFDYGTKMIGDIGLFWPVPCKSLGHHEDALEFSYSILGLKSEPLRLNVPISYECEKIYIPDAGQYPPNGETEAGQDVPDGPVLGQSDASEPDLVDSSTKDSASSDASVDGPDNIGEHTDSEASGCGVAHHARSGDVPLLLLVGAMALLGRRRLRLPG